MASIYYSFSVNIDALACGYVINKYKVIYKSKLKHNI